MDLYNDKARYDSFLNEQKNIESGFQEQGETYSNQVQNAKLSAEGQKQMGTEMFLSSMPTALMEGQQIYSKIKGVYDTAQKVAAQAQKIKEGIPQGLEDIQSKVQGAVGDIQDKVQGAVGDIQDKVQGAVGDIKSKVQGITSTGMDIETGPKELDWKPAEPFIKDQPSLQEPSVNSDIREVQFDNPLFSETEHGATQALPETFGNVKNYLGGQIGDMGSKVSVLPNAETSVGSLKQAMPKVPTNVAGEAEQLSSDVSSTATGVVSDVAETAGKIGGDILKTGSGLLEEASVPVVGDVLAGIGLVGALAEGIKGLFEKHSAPPPPPPVYTPSTAVQQAGV